MFRLVLDVVLALLVTGPGVAPAQEVDIAGQVTSLRSGEVRLTFAAREGVCGDGESHISLDGSRRHVMGTYRDDHDLRDCEEGPVRVSLKVQDGEVVKIRTRVGGSWKLAREGTLDLGEVPPRLAVDYLLTLVADSSHRVAEDAIFPAYLARDVVLWPELLNIARGSERPGGVREAAIFWLSQIAGEKVTAGLETIVDDDDEELELREHAIFALTQRGDEVCVPALTKVVRTSKHPQLRETALFWLAQSEDPRVLDLFEEILLAD